MKRLVQIVFFCIVIAIATGYFFKTKDDHLTGDRIIGVAVIAMAFILMPLFIIYRSKRSNIRNYIFPDKDKNDDEPAENQ